jgi:ribonuclease P/MRP protein subunit POP1
MITRGVPQTCARIYRLPTKDQELRKKWLNQIPSASGKGKPNKIRFPQRPGPDAPDALQRSYLAATIFANSPQPGSSEYPCTPDEEDLVGFVTTGNFNLGEGKGIGIGSLLLNNVNTAIATLKITTSISKEAIIGTHTKEERLCIIRDVGQTVGRIARWKLA